MNVERGTSTHGRYWDKKPISTSRNALEARFSHAQRTATQRMAISPNQNTAGLPMQEMEETMPAGR